MSDQAEGTPRVCKYSISANALTSRDADQTQTTDSGGVPRCQWFVVGPAFSSARYPSLCLEPDPDSVVPETPIVHTGVPHDLRPRRPRRWRRHRPRPRRRRTIAGGSAVVVVPVTAAVPVGVRAPALVPLVARAPMMVIHGCWWRRRLGSPRGQSQHGCGHTPGRERPGAQAKPWPCLCVCTHAYENSHQQCAQNRLRPFRCIQMPLPAGA